MGHCKLLVIYVIFINSIKTYCAQGYQNKLIVNCLNTENNKGDYLVNTFYADITNGFRAQAIRGTCKPGTSNVYDLQENIGYAWIKGESLQPAFLKVTSQQMINGKYMYETWSYEDKFAFVVSNGFNKDYEGLRRVPGLPPLIFCFGKDGRDKNGYCELAGPHQTILLAKIPYRGTVQDIPLETPGQSNFKMLQYRKITKGGGIYGMYWDYRNMKWNRDDCYTFTAYFSDDHFCEVTMPTKDFPSFSEAKTEAEPMLNVLGRIPRYARSWLKTIAINGGGAGSRAGANSVRKSMTLNLADWIKESAYKLFLHEGAHVGLLYIQQSEKWKIAQKNDLAFISTYAQGGSKSEDLSESYVAWMFEQQNPDSTEGRKIRQTIPNRLAVFDDLVCSKYPTSCNLQS